MRQDPDYLKLLLNQIQASPEPWPYLSEIENETIEADAKMLFHLELLEDDGFIKGPEGVKSFAFHRDGADYLCGDPPIRLTAKGHQFIEAMDQPEIWQTLKAEAPRASVTTMFDIAKYGLLASAKASGEAIKTQFGLG
ncbi:MAG: hypothetical protein CMP08_07645 [Xanthomonadales bacterium]|nr:hypothetical protein [Xanthomonadales bacterium]|tara:strand:- start:1044 stop:1457 length:414 start_codon:yes stop_codon:yes gene_type:complete